MFNIWSGIRNAVGHQSDRTAVHMCQVSYISGHDIQVRFWPGWHSSHNTPVVIASKIRTFLPKVLESRLEVGHHSDYSGTIKARKVKESMGMPLARATQG